MPKYWRRCLKVKWTHILGYEKNSIAGNNTSNSRNGSYPKKIQTEHGEAVISIPHDRNSQFELIAMPKHESSGLSDRKACYFLICQRNECFRYRGRDV